MRGRKKMENGFAKTEHIRITRKVRIGLFDARKKLGMLGYHSENDIIEALLQVI